jgi:quercetin dioxygenase-like cupin family protein
MQGVPQPSRHAHGERLVGTGRAHRGARGKDPARGGRTTITVEAGERSTWLAHPFGRTLIAVNGYGHVERDGGASERIRPGVALWFAPGEKHRLVGKPTSRRITVAIVEKPHDRR